MPRPKNLAQSPRRLNSEERQNLSWDSANSGRAAAALSDNGEDESIEIISDNDDDQRANVVDKAETGNSAEERTVAAVTGTFAAAKRPRMEYPPFDASGMRSCPHLTLNFFGNTKDADEKNLTPSDECVFLLYEFTVRPVPEQFGVFHEFRNGVIKSKNRDVWLYYKDGLFAYQFPGNCIIIRSPFMPELPVVYCESSLLVLSLRLLRQRAAFKLTYDEDCRMIRIWVKQGLFLENGNGLYSAIASSQLRGFIASVFNEQCERAGYMDPQAMKVFEIQDKAQKFYDDLKAMQRRSVPTAVEEMKIKHPDILPNLRPYQTEAIDWLLRREKGDESLEANNQLFVRVRDYRSRGEVFYYNPFGGFFLMEKPAALKPTYGGILAEEMGLGKTVEMLSLILLNPKQIASPVSDETEEDDDCSSDSLPEGLEKDAACRLEAEHAFKKKSLQEIRYRREKMETFKRKLVFNPKKMKIVTSVTMQCVCGRSSKEVDPSPRLRCPQCDTWQHSSCVQWPLTASWSDQKNYLCPSCRCSSSENAVEAKTTLIVSPASISDQWFAEIRKHVRKGALAVYIYRGVQNEGFVQPHTLAEYDVVIVAYETLRTELTYLESISHCQLRKPKRFAAAPSPLAAVKWWRLCLDEAQMVESTLAKAAKMCLRLNATYKWCITGTPIQKSIDDLFGLVLLLDVDPYSIRQFWSEALYLPYVYGRSRRLVEVLSSLLWRTAKADVLDQLHIPEQQQQLQWIEFGPVESHFYSRTKEQCSEQLSQIVFYANRQRASDNLPMLDQDMNLDTLDRQVLEQLLRPLLRLRQACCHPQLVRGGRFVNFEQMQQRMRVVTMDTVLEEMIKKTTLECEDFHRAYVSSLNGLAALEWMRERWDNAAEWYREVLRSCDEHEKQGVENEKLERGETSRADSAKPVVRTDLLQKVHALHNLNSLVNDHREEIPPTLRDDKLAQECDGLKDKYLLQSVTLIGTWRTVLQSRQSTVTEELDAFLPVWYVQVLRQLSENESDAGLLVDRLQQALMETKWWSRFRDVSGLVYLITTHSDALLHAREHLSVAVNGLMTLDMEAVLLDAQTCHLRTGATGGNGTCAICVVDPLFIEYENRLFNFENPAGGAEPSGATAVQALNDELVHILGQLRRGTWADSDLEKSLKVLYSFANRSNRRGFIDQKTMDAARKYLKVFDTLKLEFRAMRAAWTSVRDHVGRRDELRMAVERLGGVAAVAMPAHINQLKVDRAAAQNSLRRQLGQLSYLANLREERRASDQPGNANESNPEECPVCTQPLGQRWLILTSCGHSLCTECHGVLTNGNRSDYCRCPVCRGMCIKEKVRDVVFKKPLEEEQREPQKSNVVGCHSAKISAVIRCILDIRKEDPKAKCLVFSNWNEVLELLSSALRQNGLKHVLLNSAGEKFRSGLTEFKTSSSCSILLLPLKNGANGLNIVEATHVLLVEPSMNRASEQQALGRVHRIGQTKKTTVHRFLVRNSVEEHIYYLCGCDSVKMDGPLVDNGDSAVPPLTIGNLMQLFQENEMNA